MSIKSQGGVFGRNPTFNDVEVEGGLTVDGNIGIGASPLTVFDTKVATDTHIAFSGTAEDEALILAFNDGGARTPNISYAAASHKFLIGTTQKMTLDGSGHLNMSGGGNIVMNSGSGIDFSATSGTGTSELFDDYEEGTFNSSTMNFETSGSATLNQYLLGYTKVGNLVTCTGNLWVNTVTSQSGPLKIDLPFTASSGTENRSIGYVGLYDSTLTAIVKIEPSATYATVVTPYLWGTHTVSNGNTLVVSFSYHTDS